MLQHDSIAETAQPIAHDNGTLCAVMAYGSVLALKKTSYRYRSTRAQQQHSETLGHSLLCTHRLCTNQISASAFGSCHYYF
jgi:hypothetical protein